MLARGRVAARQRSTNGHPGPFPWVAVAVPNWGCNRYHGCMTTATAQTRQPVTGPESVSDGIDFDTRLMGASIFMDFVLGSDAAVQEARQQASDAIVTAARYSAEAHALEAATSTAETFQSQRILRRAAVLIRQRGWAQNSFHAADGSLCILAAIAEAAAGMGRDYRDAAQVVAERIGESLPYWNDRPGRTAEDVLAVLH